MFELLSITNWDVMRRRKNQCRLLVCIVVVLLLACGPEQIRAAELKAGVARVDLTPPMSLKATLGGYGARMGRPAEGVHDRVFAKALVLAEGTRKFVVVTADVLGFPPAVKPALLERLGESGWKSEQILLLPSHSHTSLEMGQINPKNIFGIPQIGIYNAELYELTVDNLVAVIRQAEKDLVDVSVGTSSRKIAGWNRNRRVQGGVTDEALTLTRVDKLDGSPLAVLVNFTAHPTIMAAENMLFSGGWPGHLQRTLESLIGEGVTVMYYNGAQGDQSPVSRPDSGPSRWERAEKYGRELALVCRQSWKTTVTERDVAFGYHLQPFSLPERTAHRDFMQTGGSEYGLSKLLMSELLPRLFPENSASGSLRLGELVIVGVPGEAAAELGLTIKARTREITGAQHAVIGGLANEWVSYILSAEEYERGRYEASISFYGAKLGETVVAAAVEGVKQLAAQPGK